MYTKKKNSAKMIALVLVLALLIGGAIGGTLAWLVTESETVTNTFTVGNITLTLDETAPEGYVAKMVPGTAIAKDPKVTVGANSENCWLFVKVEESCFVSDQSFADFVRYGVGEDWSEVETGDNYKVYAWKEVVNASTEAQSFYVLADSATPNTNDDYDNGCVTIPETVTKAMMDKVTTGNAPKLTFTAYAIQSENLKKDGNPVSNVKDAWSVYKNPPQENNSNP